MKTDELREKYLNFFQSKGHVRKPSDVLVPTWDPSVLFTPAGMNQFKDHFLGKVKLDFTRATTCQKCLRTGDIDNVGRTAYHHTFFEMLGNFSFGDYFKREAINWAWEFLTRKEWLGIDPGRLSVTVYLDDDEAAEIWRKDIGLLPERIERMGEDDNFWPAGAPSNGPDGVCGPCSEIFYHPEHGKSVEIWNLVFTQFNRVGNPPKNLQPLPSKNIDTGMGLERTAAQLQGVETNFHIDILKPIVLAAADVCGVQYDPAHDHGRRLRRITDHIRACTFAVHENVYPGPNKQKYVIRRLLRRAVLDGRLMGLREPFLHRLVDAVVEAMKVPYPELTQTAQRVANVIKDEESNFFGTIDAGLAHIERVFSEMDSRGNSLVPGDDAARIYQTHGVPPELCEQLAVERGFTFDWPGFRDAMKRHGDESGGGDVVAVFKEGPIESLKRSLKNTLFLGYESTETAAEIKGIVRGNSLCNELQAPPAVDGITVVLDRSPFYGESGGQVGDQGELIGDGFRMIVNDTQRDAELILHHGQLVSGIMRLGAKTTARVDTTRRQAIRRAHSATHILHYALQKNLGKHAQQQGSKVDGDWLRFDFTNMSAVDATLLARIENDVRVRVAERAAIRWETVPLSEARKAGAMMLFGEKYPDPVRMVSMGDFSRELCGGTHLGNTAEVGSFEIITEEGVSAGTRRIVALTGARADEYASQTEQTLARCAQSLGVEPLRVPAACRTLSQSVRELKKQLASGTKPNAPPSGPAATTSSAAAEPSTKQPSSEALRDALRESARILNVPLFDAASRIEVMLKEVEELRAQIEQLGAAGVVSAESLLERAERVGETTIVVTEVPGANANVMRQLIDQLRRKAAPCAVFLAATQPDGKMVLVAGITPDLVARGISAGKWVGEVAPVVGGGGGGKPDLAQAGGKHPEKLPEAIQTASRYIQSQCQ
jgi:alanyl-tRNA synthetase